MPYSFASSTGSRHGTLNDPFDISSFVIDPEDESTRQDIRIRDSAKAYKYWGGNRKTEENINSSYIANAFPDFSQAGSSSGSEVSVEKGRGRSAPQQGGPVQAARKVSHAQQERQAQLPKLNKNAYTKDMPTPPMSPRVSPHISPPTLSKHSTQKPTNESARRSVSPIQKHEVPAHLRYTREAGNNAYTSGATKTQSGAQRRSIAECHARVVDENEASYISDDRPPTVTLTTKSRFANSNPSAKLGQRMSNKVPPMGALKQEHKSTFPTKSQRQQSEPPAPLYVLPSRSTEDKVTRMSSVPTPRRLFEQETGSAHRPSSAPENTTKSFDFTRSSFIESENNIVDEPYNAAFAKADNPFSRFVGSKSLAPVPSTSNKSRHAQAPEAADTRNNRIVFSNPSTVQPTVNSPQANTTQFSMSMPEIQDISKILGGNPKSGASFYNRQELNPPPFSNITKTTGSHDRISDIPVPLDEKDLFLALHALQAQVKMLKEENAETKKTMQSQSKELENANVTLEAQHAETSKTLQAQTRELEQANAALRDQYDENRRALHAEARELEQANASLRGEYDQNRKVLQAQTNELRHANAALRGEYDETRRTLQDRVRRLEEENASLRTDVAGNKSNLQAQVNKLEVESARIRQEHAEAFDEVQAQAKIIEGRDHGQTSEAKKNVEDAAEITAELQTTSIDNAQVEKAQGPEEFEIYEDEPTMRPIQPPGISLRLVIESLEQELAREKSALENATKAYSEHFHGYGMRQRQVLKRKMESLVASVEAKSDRLYLLHDIIEAGM